MADLLNETKPQILATGGGAIIRETSRLRLKESNARVVYLAASVEVLAQRLARGRNGVRPSLSGRPIEEEVGDIMRQRAPWYEEVADFRVSAESSSIK